MPEPPGGVPTRVPPGGSAPPSRFRPPPQDGEPPWGGTERRNSRKMQRYQRYLLILREFQCLNLHGGVPTRVVPNGTSRENPRGADTMPNRTSRGMPNGTSQAGSSGARTSPSPPSVGTPVK